MGSPRQPVEDSDSYWEWKTDSKQVLSTNHIESNLHAAGKTIAQQPSQSLKSENDDYWSEHPQEQLKEVQPANYWDDQVPELSESDNYWNWNTEESKVTPSIIRNTVVSQTDSDNYWNWSS